jgi:mannose-6-phosphate isomerase-like protein (cupin superfamily)
MQTKTEQERVRQQWGAESFSCEIWIDPPDQVWHDFQHDVDKRALLLEGIVQIEMQGKDVRLQAGDELMIPAGTRHTVRNCGSGPARWLHGYRVHREASQG